MSASSKRERIIVDVVNTLADLSWVKRMERQKLTLDELKNFATTQLPLIGVIGSLPNPRENTRSARKVPDTFISDLGIDIICYGLDNVNPDSTISNYFDDIWKVLFALEFNSSLGVITVDVKPTAQQAMWKPYFAFVLKYVVTYSHTKGGI